MDDLFLILFLVSIGCLFIGLVRPSLFSFFFKGWATRGKLSCIFSGVMVLFFVLFGMTTESPESENIQPATEKIESEVAVIPNEIPTEETKQVELYEIVSVTDGDTLKVNINGTIETLRLIGMDTPETVDPRTSVQCFGKEASNKAKETLTGKKVRLESDASQGELDKYNRLLRYVFLEDGTSYNKMMIEEGYAHEYTYNTPYKYQAEYKEAEKNARETKKGFWGDTCGGDTTQPAEKPAPAPTPAPKAESSAAPSGGAGWTCNCKKTCDNMSCAEAQYQLNSCSCTARDRDGDGIACDSQCGG